MNIKRLTEDHIVDLKILFVEGSILLKKEVLLDLESITIKEEMSSVSFNIDTIFLSPKRRHILSTIPSLMEDFSSKLYIMLDDGPPHFFGINKLVMEEERDLKQIKMKLFLGRHSQQENIIRYLERESLFKEIRSGLCDVNEEIKELEEKIEEME